ncbi:MAG: tetratricopeptide repeat protein [SAR324 cluster bacterium]|uniref:Tetratricopeptide repeat protein n=1 Tax=SAR324 cluster bacterium TaxID=2024889 RepID=A0A7X9IJM6_9DELT|nr:tetratricopeptide repeat protein [SAR324 cluster bacterium]
MNKALIHLILIIFLSACSVIETPDPFQIQQAELHVDRGSIYLELNDLQRAEAEFGLALEIAPLAAAMDGLGCVTMMKGDFKEAEKLFQKAHEMDISYHHSLANLALLYEIQGDKRKAQEFYEEEIGLELMDYRARNNYAALRYDLFEDLDEAQGLMLQAQAINTHPLIQDNLSVLEGIRAKRKNKSEVLKEK